MTSITYSARKAAVAADGVDVDAGVVADARRCRMFEGPHFATVWLFGAFCFDAVRWKTTPGIALRYAEWRGLS